MTFKIGNLAREAVNLALGIGFAELAFSILLKIASCVFLRAEGGIKRNDTAGGGIGKVILYDQLALPGLRQMKVC
ncbi:hypothetical protein SDC9_130703 [bioreactor metagenome]|uniref:Uncharacterized protein n=1 Tax=bioreactor metagenome TaxID=1076179 RepID=A0A645D2W5_9ZZZZ